jgi:uroporphyrinogen-III synthase
MKLAARGVPALACPLTRIVRVAPPPEPPPGTEAWVFTSGNAVPAAAPAGPAGPARAYCVGAATARKARRAGFEGIEAGGDAEALLAALLAAPESRFFQPRGAHLARELAPDLAAAGKSLAEALAYEAVAVEALPPAVEDALAEGRVGTVGFWSPRAGRVYAALTEGAPAARDGIAAVAISENAARAVGGLGFARVDVAERPDAAAMLDALERVARA